MNTRSPGHVDLAIGQRIRLARKIAKLSQAQLGERIGVTYQQVQKYENGTDRVSASRLFQIASEVGVPANYFFEELATSGSADILDRETVELVRDYKAIPSEALRQAIRQIARNMRDQGEAPKDEPPAGGGQRKQAQLDRLTSDPGSTRLKAMTKRHRQP